MSWLAPRPSERHVDSPRLVPQQAHSHSRWQAPDSTALSRGLASGWVAPSIAVERLVPTVLVSEAGGAAANVQTAVSG
jgi:hypothetical protein